MGGLAYGSPVGFGMTVDDIRTQGYMHGMRDAQFIGLGQETILIIWKLGLYQGCAYGLTQAVIFLGSVNNGFI